MKDFPPLVKNVNGTLYRQASNKAVLWIGLVLVLMFIAGTVLTAMAVIALTGAFKNTPGMDPMISLIIGLGVLVISVKTIGWLFIENAGLLWVKVRAQGIPAPRKYDNGEMA